MAELEKAIAELRRAAPRNDKLTLAELQGGTFTISNGGIFGSMLSTPILNPPQTGILGMHNIVERAGGARRPGGDPADDVPGALATTTAWSTAARRCSSSCASRSASRTPSGSCSRCEALRHAVQRRISGGRLDFAPARPLKLAVSPGRRGRENGRPLQLPLQTKEASNGNWYREVVQRREGLRLHHSGRRRRGRVLPPHRHQLDGFRTLAEGQKVEFEVPGAPRACRRRTFARPEPPEPLLTEWPPRGPAP